MTFLDRASEMQHREPTTELESVLRQYSWANSIERLDVVVDNDRVLRKAGLLEEAFLDAWSYRKWGIPSWDDDYCEFWFAHLDRAALLKAGDPLPAGDSFVVYRGVAGDGIARRVRGYSWTGDEGTARRFARLRVENFGLGNPAVYSAVIKRADVLAYIDASGKDEKEFLLLPRKLAELRIVEEAR